MVLRFAVCGLILLSGPGALAGKADPPSRVEIAAVEGGTIEARPGEVVAVGFFFSNPSDEAISVGASVELPAGWTLLFGPDSVSLEPRARSLRLVSVRAPGLAPPGEHVVRIIAHDPGSSAALWGEAALSVLIRPVHAITVTPAHEPVEQGAGADYQVGFLVANVGNEPFTVHLEAWAASGVAWSEVRELRLDRGGSEEVLVTATAPSPVGRRGGHTVWLRALLGEEVLAQGSVRSAVRTDRASPKSSRSGYPVYVRVSGGGRNGGLGPQLEVGTASVRTDPRHSLSFLIRPPSTEPSSLYLPDDQYFVRYRTGRFSAVLGDQVYGLTPLTTTGLYGFGGSLRLEEEDYALEGYALRSRFPGEDVVQGGLRVEHAIEGVGLFGTSFVADGGGKGQQVGAVSFAVTPIQGVEADAEFGIGAAGARALRARVAGNPRGFRYEGRVLHTDPDYLGPQRGIGLRTISASALLGRGIEASGTWRSTSRTFDSGGGSRHERLVQGGVGLRGRALGGHAHASVALVDRVLATPTARTQWERGLDGQVRIDLRGILGVGARVGMGWEQTVGDPAPYLRSEAHARFQSGSHVLRATLGHTQGRGVHLIGGRGRWHAIAQWTGRVGGHSRLGLQAYTSSIQGRPEGRYVALQLQASHTLRWGHEVSLRARISEAGSRFNARDASYLVSYTAPISLPSSSADRSQAIAGHVYLEDSAMPVVGAVLHLDGQTAVTEANGTFALRAPTSGAAYLRLDPASLPAGLVAARPLPILVGEGTPEPLMIPVVPGGSVEGRAVRYGAVTGLSREEELGGVPGIVLEFEGLGGRYRTVTDGDGRFRFPTMPTGMGRLRVVHARLPEHHAFEQEEVGVEVKAGETVVVGLDVRPRRPARVLEGGRVRRDDGM